MSEKKSTKNNNTSKNNTINSSKYYANSLIFQSPDPKRHPEKMPCIPEQLTEAQQLYLQNIKDNWEGEVTRLRKSRHKNKEWIPYIKSLDEYSGIMRKLCLLLQEDKDILDPENEEFIQAGLYPRTVTRFGKEYYAKDWMEDPEHLYIEEFMRRLLNSIRYLNEKRGGKRRRKSRRRKSHRTRSRRRKSRRRKSRRRKSHRTKSRRRTK